MKKEKEPYVHDPNKLSEKIGNFCEHVIAGFLIGLMTGVGLGFCWLMSQV